MFLICVIKKGTHEGHGLTQELVHCIGCFVRGLCLSLLDRFLVTFSDRRETLCSWDGKFLRHIGKGLCQHPSKRGLL